MTIKLYGKTIEKVGRNDLHNTYSVKNHVPSQPKMQRPFYKNLYENQLNNNKILLWTIGLSWLFCGALCGGTLSAKNTVIGTLQHEVDLSRITLTTYADQQDFLLKENASCSAQLKNAKLSPKARTHMKQQPVVAEKIKYTFGNEWAEATELISRESSLNPEAVNPSSLACGLGQALPCSKMNCSLTDVDCQLNWVKDYITHRYGNVSKALAYHDQKGWY